MTSSSSIDKVPSASGGMKTFFTTGIGPWTSYSPSLWLNVASPKSEPGARAEIKQVKKNKSDVQKIYLMHERNINSLINIIPSIAASNALLVSSRNSSEAAIKPRESSLS
jgi:hypothetical protein